MGTTDVVDSEPAPTAAKKPLWRRLLRILGFVLLGMLLAALAYIAYLWFRVPSDSLDPVKPGSLTLSDTAGGTAEVGGYVVRVGADSDGKNPQLTITQGEGGPVVWRSVPGKAFLGAGVGGVEWTEKFGFFWADVKREATLLDQQIDAVTPSAGGVQVSGVLTGGDVTAPYTMTLAPVAKSDTVSVVGMDVTVGDTSTGQRPSSVVINAGLDEGEEVYGFGEQFRDFNLVGTTFPLLVQEQGIGRGEQPITFLADLTNWAGANLGVTYAAWPTYVTNSNRSFALADVESSGGFGVVDMSRSGELTFETWAPTVKAELAAAGSPKELMSVRAAGVSHPPLADWAQRGAILGLQGGTEKVRQVVAEMQAAGTQISGVWLQDWVGKRQTSFGSQLWWTWQLDEEQYPGWDQMVADFEDQGIRVLTYVNPFLADAADKADPNIRNLYQEAEEKGFLIKNQEGGTYVIETVGFPVGLMDLTNPAARDWYADVIATEVIAEGAAGFMADFGEALPFDAVLFEGDALQQHNRYPELWAETVRTACDRAGQPDCMAFMRASYLGSPKSVPMMWAGDQMVTYAPQDGLASTVLGMNAGGVSGFPLWHSDIGGYTSINAVVKNYVRPPNLNARWAEYQAFGVMMRTHETNRPEQNQQVFDSPETIAPFALASRWYAALYDYRKTVIDEATATGIPAMRHSWLVHPGTKAADADLQFFLGDHLLMAPVLSEDATTTKVTFPPGTWTHLLTGETFQGDQEVEVDSPLGTPAVFVQQGDPVGDQIRSSFQAAGLTTG